MLISLGSAWLVLPETLVVEENRNSEIELFSAYIKQQRRLYVA